MAESQLEALRAYYEKTVHDLVSMLLIKDRNGREGKDTHHFNTEIAKLNELKRTLGEVIEEAHAIYRSERLGTKNG